MPKTPEQLIREQFGAMAFQIVMLMADLEAVKEERDTLKAEQTKAKSDNQDR